MQVQCIFGRLQNRILRKLNLIFLVYDKFRFRTYSTAVKFHFWQLYELKNKAILEQPELK